ncbi:hypothetical protein B0H17DRAFT_1337237 [Mycena rosella]|uniref:Uncharacterized protein n=1 Tax=Mycena rosella TaxID=1033263 RepID=A0AAD7G6D6_MYCRO|nr:hypothetical protein B0H17DRAFT_1337237 [Mycena rosella]
MLRHAVRAFAAPVTRIGISLKSAGWAAPALYWTRKHTTSSPEVIQIPGYPNFTRHSYFPSPLPAAPEASTAPLVQSDFTQYLEPLYKYGWAFSFRRAIEGSPQHGLSFLWRRFVVPSPKELGALCEHTRNKPCDIELFPNLETKIFLRSPDGVTRSMIRHALELETGYQNLCPAAPGRYVAPKFHVTSSDAAQALAQTTKPRPPTSISDSPIVPASLPSPPSAPSSPPPSITEADLEKYVQPLITNGWMVSPVSANRAGSKNPLKGQPSLNRIYKFHDYSSAHDFFLAVIPAIPAPIPNSPAGVRIRSSPNSPTVQLTLISELAQDTSQTHKYGISHADLRLAIEVETEFMKNWAGKADNTAFPRTVPTTMEQVWNGRRSSSSS